MSEYSKEVENAAKNAFVSPSQLAARRLGRRTPTSSSPILGASSSFGGGGGGGDDRSVRSRRSQSLITSPDSAEIFDQMHSATTVQVGGGSGLPRGGPSPLTIGSVVMGTAANNRSASSPIAGLFSFASMGSNSISNHSRDNNSDNGGRSSVPLPEQFESDGENYFSSGGALSIETPGKVDERDLDDDDSDYSDDDDDDNEVTGINTRKGHEAAVAATQQQQAAGDDNDAAAAASSSPKTTTKTTTTTAPKKKLPPPAIKTSSSMSPTSSSKKCSPEDPSTSTAELVKKLVVEHGTTEINKDKKKPVKKRKSSPEKKKPAAVPSTSTSSSSSSSPLAAAATKKILAKTKDRQETETLTSTTTNTSTTTAMKKKTSPSLSTKKKSLSITSLPVLPVTPKSPTRTAALAKKKKNLKDDSLFLSPAAAVPKKVSSIASVATPAPPAPEPPAATTEKSSVASVAIAIVAGDETKKQHDDVLSSALKSEPSEASATEEKSSTVATVAPTGALPVKQQQQQQQQQQDDSTASKSVRTIEYLTTEESSTTAVGVASLAKKEQNNDSSNSLVMSTTQVAVGGSVAKKEQDSPAVPPPPITLPPTATASEALSVVLDTVSAALMDTESKQQDAVEARAAAKARVAAALAPLLELCKAESLSSPKNAQVLLSTTPDVGSNKAPLSPRQFPPPHPPVGANKAPLSPPRAKQLPVSPPRTRQVPPPAAVGGKAAPLSPPRAVSPMVFDFSIRRAPSPLVLVDPVTMRAPSPIVLDVGPRRAPSPLVVVGGGGEHHRRPQGPPAPKGVCGEDVNNSGDSATAAKNSKRLPVMANTISASQHDNHEIKTVKALKPSVAHVKVPKETMSLSDEKKESSPCESEATPQFRGNYHHVKIKETVDSTKMLQEGSKEKQSSMTLDTSQTATVPQESKAENSNMLDGDLFWEPSDAILSELRTITEEEETVGTEDRPVGDENQMASTSDVFYTPAKEQPPVEDIFHTPAQEEFSTPTFHTAEMSRLPSPPAPAPSISEDGSKLDAFDLMVAPTLSVEKAISQTPVVERAHSKHAAAASPTPTNRIVDIKTTNHAIPRADSDITDQLTTQPVESYSDLGIAFSTTNLSGNADGNAASRNLKFNDSDFHLLANQLVKFFQSKAVNDQNQMILTSSDRDKIQQILPATMLLNFIEAVRFRLRNRPSEPSTPLHFVLLQCHDFGMDREGAQNPVFVALSISDHKSATVVIRRNSKIAVTEAQPPAGEVQPQTKQMGSTADQSLSSSADSQPNREAADASTASDSAIHIGTIDETSKTTVDSMSDGPFHIGTVDETSKHSDSSAGYSSAGSAFAAVAPVSSEKKQAVWANVDPIAIKGPLVPDITPTTAANEPKPPAANEPKTPAFVPPAEVGKGDQSLDGSLLTAPDNNSVQGNASTGTTDPEIARQQLLAELREASNLMAESENQETAQFWRKHVLDLQVRLRALHGDGTSVASHTSQKTPEDILESNRRVVSEFQRREQYLPPNLESPDIKHDHPYVPPKPVQPFEYDAPMVDVVAPADLPGGYHFEAEIECTRFLATVPPGGVQQGETFTCYMRELNSVAIDIPVGYWKDNMSNVFKYGCCHPVPWHGLFCPLFALSQIGHRVQLDFLGRSSPPGDSPRFSNRTMVLTVTFFWIFMNLALFGGYNLKWSRGLEISFADLAALALVNISMFGFTVFVTQSTRYSLREKFMIREDRCYDLEDVVVSTFCLPCTVCQMARHTANYDDYEAVCCSKSGLPDNVRVNQGPREQEDDPNKYTMMV